MLPNQGLPVETKWAPAERRARSCRHCHSWSEGLPRGTAGFASSLLSADESVELSSPPAGLKRRHYGFEPAPGWTAHPLCHSGSLASLLSKKELGG